MTATDSSPAVAPSRRVPGSVRWITLLVVLALAPVAVAAAFGSFGMARNDDWSYADLLWRWTEHGDLNLGGWESMTLVGQLVLAWPVGRLAPHNAGALQVFTACIGLVGAVAAFGTLDRFLSRSRALLAVALTLISPMYAPLAASFMTDVPAFATQAVCAWLGTGALTSAGRRRGALFVAAIAVGAFGVSIREYAIVAPVTVLLVFGLQAWGRRDRSGLTLAVGIGVVAAVALAFFVAWRRSWANSLSLDPAIPSSISDGGSSFGRSTLFTIATLTFLILPVFAFAPVRAILREITSRRWAVVASASAAIVLVVGVVATWTWSPPLLGPYLDQRGALGDDILPGIRSFVVPSRLLQVVLVVVVLCSVLLAGIVVLTLADIVAGARTWRARCASLDPRSFAWVFVVLTVASLTAAGTTELPIFDRYVLPAVPFAAGLVLAWRSAEMPLTERGRPRVMPWIAVLAFFGAGLVWAVDSAKFDAIRWRAGEEAERRGYPADRIDAGFEWRNVNRTPGQSPMSPSQPDPDACIRLGAPQADLGPGAVPLYTVDYWHGLAGSETLTAWAVGGRDCPPLP